MTRAVDSHRRAMAVVVIAAVVAAVVVLGSCQTFESYGRAYAHSTDEIPGVPALPALTEHQANGASARQAAFGQEKADELVVCERLRAQLAYGSRAATTHTACVWGCPLAWPVGILSAFVWPIHETRTAQAVWQAAEDLERAYQSDTDAFLTTCRVVRDGDVGRAFSNVLSVPTPSSSAPTAATP